MRLAVAVAFVGTVYAANFALRHFGTVPVWPGIEAPAGVYFAGLGFILRDALHEFGGRVWVFGAILAGAALSLFLGADATIPGGHVSIAVASGCSFLLAETADLAVYAPLRARNAAAAVGASQVAGAMIDSALFLWLAFGSLALIGAQLVGKLLLVVPVVCALAGYRRLRVHYRYTP